MQNLCYYLLSFISFTRILGSQFPLTQTPSQNCKLYPWTTFRSYRNLITSSIITKKKIRSTILREILQRFILIIVSYLRSKRYWVLWGTGSTRLRSPAPLIDRCSGLTCYPHYKGQSLSWDPIHLTWGTIDGTGVYSQIRCSVPHVTHTTRDKLLLDLNLILIRMRWGSIDETGVVPPKSDVWSHSCKLMVMLKFLCIHRKFPHNQK